ncbi:MAG: tetratricopeptide repeat protein [Patescibacteria group bacterium]|nr:MAG: tetratricopeptide repeat protein [Patescibacteria group bacterium]
MWTIIGIVLVLTGLALIYGVLVKKFPQLKLIDLSTLAKERHEAVKKRIMQDRFERSLGKIQGKTNEAVGAASSRVKNWFERAQDKLKGMEARMDGHVRRTVTPAEQAKAVERLPSLLDQAEHARLEERYEEAEKLYIEALKADAKNVEAYRGLAELYLAQRQPDQAAEILEFLLRLQGDDDRALGRLGQIEANRGNFEEAEVRYLRSIELATNATMYRTELGRVYLAQGEGRKAADQFRMALQSEPHNPKYLDYFLEASILVGDADAAREALLALEEVNPENAKLAEFRERISEMTVKT